MDSLKNKITGLPPITVGDHHYLPTQAVTDAVAAFLFPDHADQMDEVTYQQVVETAVSICHTLGYKQIELKPPDVPLSNRGRYWLMNPSAENVVEETNFDDLEPLCGSSGMAELLEDGLLLDARLTPLDLEEVTRQHFKIPVLGSEAVIDLMHKAVNSDWPNDYKGLWHDILGMCRMIGRDVGSNERHFQVIIQGVGRRRKWDFKATIKQDNAGDPFMYIDLRGVHGKQEKKDHLFKLGHVVMTLGASELGINLMPYITRHVTGDWEHLDAYDQRQNKQALKNGERIFTSFEIPVSDAEDAWVQTIFIITEWDRSLTTVMCASEY